MDFLAGNGSGQGIGCSLLPIRVASIITSDFRLPDGIDKVFVGTACGVDQSSHVQRCL